MSADAASVLCVVTDETSTRRFNYSLPFSSAVTDLYTAVAHEAGVILIMQNMVGIIMMYIIRSVGL